MSRHKQLLVHRNLTILRLMFVLRTRKKKSVKLFAVHPLRTPRERLKRGEYQRHFMKLRTTDEAEFKNYTRMTPFQFDVLLQLIEPKFAILRF